MSKVHGGDVIPGNVAGNATTDTKEFVQLWLSLFASRGFGAETSKRMELVEVSIVPNIVEPSREEGRIVLELVVTEDMLDSTGRIHSACVVLLADLCTSLVLVAMSFEKTGNREPGVSQDISVIYHAPASLGDRLKLINTSMVMSARAWTARLEVWDVAHHRLVASATQIRMIPTKL